MLRVVIPFFRGDVTQMADLLRWAIELDPDGVEHNCLLSYQTGTDPSEIRTLTRQYFKGDIQEVVYSEPPVAGWPASPNWAWQATARYIDDAKINEPWLWWESDAVPLKPGWLDAIHDGWKAGGKAFAGHIVEGMEHMNGVGVYPPDVRKRCNEAMLCRQAAWDVVLKTTITGHCTKLNHLIQHVWNIRESDGAIWNGDGKPVTFPDWAAVERYMDFNCVLIHRTKDGTLIQRLREHMQRERERIDAEQRMINSVETNVPNFTGTEAAVEAPRQVDKISGVHFMIVTYQKDYPWFELCIRCINKHVTGFDGITVCVPNTDKSLFTKLAIRYGFRLYGYDEVEGKGMLQHMAVMAMADQIMPTNTKYVAHLDSDAMFKMPTTPEDYFVDGKPVQMIRTYESLVDDKGVVSDCAQWRPVVEEQIAIPATHFTMCAFPFIYPIEMYSNYRKRIEYVHKKPMLDYMLEGRNTFPQTRVDFQAMGMFAYATMRDRIHWIDIGVNPPRKDRHKSYWSHAGVTSETRKEIEKFLES